MVSHWSLDVEQSGMVHYSEVWRVWTLVTGVFTLCHSQSLALMSHLRQFRRMETWKAGFPLTLQLCIEDTRPQTLDTLSQCVTTLVPLSLQLVPGRRAATD